MRTTKTALTHVVLVSLLLATCATNAGSPQDKAKATTPIEGFPDASLTLFPLTFFTSGERWQQDETHRAWAAAFGRGFLEDKARPCAHTLGLLLEEKGYDKIEVADREFEFPRVNQPPREARVAAFGKFVSEQDLKTDYALWTEVGLTEDTGLDVYSVIADANGHVVWKDSQEQRGKTEFDCLELTCNRLAPVLGLDTLPKREMTEDRRRMLREVRAKEPPSGSERHAMNERREALKQAGASARVLVYPARVGGNHTDAHCATHLSSLLNEVRLCQASAAKTGPVMEGGGWPNEMQVLWLFARTVRDYVREHSADTDYVLFPDYWFNPRGQVWAVHFVLCDRTGEWVIVDLQNSHQEDFQRISPKNLQDCDQLVRERFRAQLH